MAMAKNIRDVMTKNPRTVSNSDTVSDAARRMRDEDAGLIPIVDGDRLMGVITDRDIALRVVADGRDASSMRVEEIASKSLVTVDPDQGLDEALKMMAEHQVRRLPVCEEDGRLIGIVAQADIAKHAGAKRTGEVVEQISS
jgi:CBS domain-containing protein